MWKEEGTATKTGNTYVGEVSHFSFWNCDVPNNYVQFNCTIKDQAGNPLPYVTVKISIVGGSPYDSRYGWTDSSGYVSGAIPNDAQLLLEVFTSYYCGSAVYSQNFTTTNVNISLGDILVPTPSNLATISGIVTDCSNNPVTNGRIIVQENGGYYYYSYPLTNTGSFSFTRVLCNGTATINIIAEDLSASQQSSPLTATLTAGTNALGNLQACGISTQEFITYSIDGGTTSTTFTAPADSIFHSANGTIFQSTVNGYTPTTNNYVDFSFDNAGIGVGTTQPLVSFFSTPTGQGTTTGTVNITEYGAIGEYISGDVTGVMVNSTPTTYNIVCSFRVRRNF